MNRPLHAWLGEVLPGVMPPEELALLQVLAGRDLGATHFLPTAAEALEQARSDMPPWLLPIAAGPRPLLLDLRPLRTGGVVLGWCLSPEPGAYGVSHLSLSAVLCELAWAAEERRALGLAGVELRPLVEPLLGPLGPSPGDESARLKARWDRREHTPVAALRITTGLPDPAAWSLVASALLCWPEDAGLQQQACGLQTQLDDFDAAGLHAAQALLSFASTRHLYTHDDLLSLVEDVRIDAPEAVSDGALDLLEADAPGARRAALATARSGEDPWLPLLLAANLGHRYGFGKALLADLSDDLRRASQAALLPLAEARAALS